MAAPREITSKNVSGKWILNKALSDSTDGILKLQGIPWLIRRMVSFATITLNIKQYTTTSINLSSFSATATTFSSTSFSSSSPPTNANADSNITHIDITQIVTPGGIITTESRILDWTLRDHKDHVFGDVKLKARWVRLGDLRISGKGKEKGKGNVEDGEDGEGNADGDVDEFLVKGWEGQDRDQEEEEKEEEEEEEEEEHGYVQTFGASERKGWVANQIWGFEIINNQRHYTSHLELRKGGERLLARLVYDYVGVGAGA